MGMFRKIANIAFTYAGDTAAYGDGHKSPSVALAKLVRQDPRFANEPVLLLPRFNANLKMQELLQDGTLRDLGDYDGRHIKTLVSTHYGAYLEDPAKRSTTHSMSEADMKNYDMRVHGYSTNINVNVPKNKFIQHTVDKAATGKFGITSMEHAMKNVPKESNLFIVGPTRGLEEHSNKVQMSEHITPAIDRETIRANQNLPSREEVIRNLAKTYIDDAPKKAPEATEARRAIAKKIKDIRGASRKENFVVVSGSGAGAYVSSRAKDLDNVIKKRNVDSKIGFLSLHGGASRDIPELLDGITTGTSVNKKLPVTLFNQLQAVSDVSWGNSGSSSLQESLTQPTVVASPKRWGGGNMLNEYNPELRKIVERKGSIVDIQRRLVDKVTGLKEKLIGEHRWFNVEPGLDGWNPGNIEHAIQQKGVMRADNADMLVDNILNKKKMMNLKADAKVRAAFFAEEHQKAQNKFLDSLHSVYSKESMPELFFNDPKNPEEVFKSHGGSAKDGQINPLRRSAAAAENSSFLKSKLGKGLLIGGGIAAATGLGFGGKYLYDKYEKKGK